MSCRGDGKSTSIAGLNSGAAGCKRVRQEMGMSCGGDGKERTPVRALSGREAAEAQEGTGRG